MYQNVFILYWQLQQNKGSEHKVYTNTYSLSLVCDNKNLVIRNKVEVPQRNAAYEHCPLNCECRHFETETQPVSDNSAEINISPCFVKH